MWPDGLTKTDSLGNFDANDFQYPRFPDIKPGLLEGMTTERKISSLAKIFRASIDNLELRLSMPSTNAVWLSLTLIDSTALAESWYYFAVASKGLSSMNFLKDTIDSASL